MYTIAATRYFLRRAKKFFRKHPELREDFSRVVDELKEGSLHSAFSLGGNLEGLFAVRLTYCYRITLTLKVTEKEIILLDIGSHDEVYRRK
ncbi:MAG: hypothetical protein MRJ65_13305 [Candidatus Brocadiaceae bacterium]|nr:hypothetical protein [Candidatus Brocadiaceae bacterium]